IGQRRLTWTLPEGATVGDLRRALREAFPQAADVLDRALIALNHTYVDDATPISDGAEVAFFPPVSGGAEKPTVVQVLEGPIDLNALLAQIVQPTTGAACIFSGVVRAQTTLQEGQTQHTSYLEYEAYVPMAEAKMRQVAQEIRERWPEVEGIAVVQRIGRLEPGTPTVLIAVTAPHRHSGVFEAARYGIDRLKEIVPIWKKEVGPDGEAWVEGHYHPKPGE
ncbi:MAG: molybdopterin converting factor, partial [Chloroflexi bacterium]|nr:molybdopterin converting factor [Chloroflexota bacterium]